MIVVITLTMMLLAKGGCDYKYTPVTMSKDGSLGK